MSHDTVAPLDLTGNGEHLTQGQTDVNERSREISERHSHEDLNGSINPIEIQIK